MIKITYNNKKIINYTIYAERHCGTNFLEKYIAKNYNDLPITWDFGFKHFFGYKNSQIIKSDNTLFIGIVRNPYDWLFAMKKQPHLLRRWHLNSKHYPYSSIYDFLQAEIESYWYGKEVLEDRHMIYGRRYKNIFELRNTKNDYLLNTMPSIAQNYILINYEILYTNFKYFLDQLNHYFNLDLKEFTDNNFDKKNYNNFNKKNIELINNNLNWNIENAINYHAV